MVRQSFVFPLLSSPLHPSFTFPVFLFSLTASLAASFAEQQRYLHELESELQHTRRREEEERRRRGKVAHHAHLLHEAMITLREEVGLVGRSVREETHRIAHLSTVDVGEAVAERIFAAEERRRRSEAEARQILTEVLVRPLFPLSLLESLLFLKILILTTHWLYFVSADGASEGESDTKRPRLGGGGSAREVRTAAAGGRFRMKRDALPRDMGG